MVDQSNFRAGELVDKEAIIKEVASYSGGKVRVATTDIDGILRGKIISTKKFLSAAQDRFGFCDVVFGWDANDRCYDNVDHTGWHTGYPDAMARIDFSTFRHVPWENGIPFFLTDLELYEGDRLEITPRNLLKKIRDEATEMGFKAMFSQEFEWFNFRETSDSLHEKGFRGMNTLSKGMFGYSLLRSSQNSPFFHDLFDLLSEFRVPLEGLHTETGPGVYEAALLYDEVLEAADRATLFKASVKEIGHRHGITPTFMAKWNDELPGCSGHLHQSLWDIEKNKNAFYSSEEPQGLNEIMSSFIAGQLHCLRYILPMFAPTINSYKRLVEGHWAPTTLTWGIDNRTASLRALTTGPKSTRVEHRVVGSDVNPYLAMAASLASGLYGIKKNLKLEIPPSLSNAYKEKTYGSLARTLEEATRLMDESEISRELFGEKFVNHFVQTRQWEWREHLKAITDWEFKRYFEVI